MREREGTRAALSSYLFFFFNDTATTEIYTLSLHDALPISAARPRPAAEHAPFDRRRPPRARVHGQGALACAAGAAASRGSAAPRARLDLGAETRGPRAGARAQDRKSTRLNSSHLVISYAVF